MNLPPRRRIFGRLHLLPTLAALVFVIAFTVWYGFFAGTDSKRFVKNTPQAPVNLVTVSLDPSSANKTALTEYLQSHRDPSRPNIFFVRGLSEEWDEAFEKLKYFLPFSISIPRSDPFGILFMTDRKPAHLESISLDEDPDLPTAYAVFPLPTGENLHVFGIHPVSEDPTRRGSFFTRLRARLDNIHRPDQVVIMGGSGSNTSLQSRDGVTLDSYFLEGIIEYELKVGPTMGSQSPVHLQLGK